MRLIKPSTVTILFLILAACQSNQVTHSSIEPVSRPRDRPASLVTLVSTAWPTRASITATPTARSIIRPTGTPVATVVPEVDEASTEIPAYPVQVDHYLMIRPISRSGIDYVDRTYAYGDTQRGRRETHKGVEFVNPRGTPVLAVADGTVIFAGRDNEILVGPYPDYYGNVIILEHRIDTLDELPVYTVYGHLDRAAVVFGQVVEAGDQIGTVGAEGIADGAHLHFEVRAGDALDFGSTQNPDLWIYPYPTFGTLAGRVVDANGELQYGVGIEIAALNEAGERGTIRYAFTYADESVNPTVSWNENFTMGDLPEGDYEVTIGERGRVRFRGQVTIEPNATTFVEIVVE